MALFVVNRFLDDTVKDVKDGRSQALLEKVVERAKARQLEKQQASFGGQKKAKLQNKVLKDNSTSPAQEGVRNGVGGKEKSPSAAKKKKQRIEGGQETDKQAQISLSDHSETENDSMLKKEAKKKRLKRESELVQDDEVLNYDGDGTEVEVGKKVKNKKMRKKRKSEMGEDESGREEVVKKTRKRRKSEQSSENDEAGGHEEGKMKSRIKASRQEEEDETEQSDDGESDGAEENRSQELNPSKEEQEDDVKEEVAAGTDPEISSLVLGGFERKAAQKVHRVLPHWLSHPSLVQKDIKQHLVPIHEVPGIHPKMLKKLKANQIHSFFPVQAQVIPAILESTCHGFLIGRGGYRPSDICVSAPTGSGKTLAFVIPVIQALLERVVCCVRALVVLPTKELAQQVGKVFSIYADGTSLKVVLVTGQKSFSREQEAIVEKTMMGYRSLADIIVATPGRLVDHIEQTPGFSLKQLRFLVIDEADRMIDSMSQDWLHRVIKAVYRQEEGDDPSNLFTRKEPGPITAASTWVPQMPLQKLLFSATLTQNPEKLQKLGLYLPRLFTSTFNRSPDSAETTEDSELKYTLPEGLSQYYLPCNLNLKPLILLHLLVTLKYSRVLCFTNTKQASHRLFLLIRAFGGVNAAEFSSLLSPSERQRTLREFKQGNIQILISTDATSRGIDIEGVRCVINYDAPQYFRVYIHRVGRTARAGKSGLSFTMLLRVQEEHVKKRA
ncbi:ATP-dependent RNA helicase DDX51 isoform X2 [Pleurodeles waltl]|uniref:ATP-dependent RNA helicase DDX51 isoform X2 n=1 Tax=Pleurodeles waltl TaxID=8319 RepID=UPI0037094605